MRFIHEMRAFKNDVEYEVVGYIILDEDHDEPVMDIYEDPRMPVCGSNWSLYPTQHVPVPEAPGNVYVHGDWFGKGIIDLNIPWN